MSALAAQFFREVRPDFFGVLARPSARLYVDSLDALEYEAVQRNQLWRHARTLSCVPETEAAAETVAASEPKNQPPKKRRPIHRSYH